VQDSILVAGYPLGGDSLSITKGIVSRVTMTRYAHASNKLLGIQIDAAINPGFNFSSNFANIILCRPLHPLKHFATWALQPLKHYIPSNIIFSQILQPLKHYRVSNIIPPKFYIRSNSKSSNIISACGSSSIPAPWGVPSA
jgi:hypothetical protein